MEGGTSTGLYILVGIVIFGIFLLIVGIFFSDAIQGMIDDSTTGVSGAVNANMSTALSNLPGGGSVSAG